MADLSLDDYIRKKNFTVEIKNDNWNGNNNKGDGGRIQHDQNRGPSVRVTGLGNVKQFDMRQKIGPKKVFDARQRLQTKKPVDARRHLSGGKGNARQMIAGPDEASSTLRQYGSAPASRPTGIRVTGLGNTRQTVTGPNAVSNSISARLGDNRGNDARSKITSLKRQKGTFDARSMIPKQQQQKEQQKSQSTVYAGAGSGPGPGTTNTKVFTSHPGAKIQLTTSGLQVTRSVPDATVSFEGSMLTVTKRRQDYHAPESTEAVSSYDIQDEQPDYEYDDDDCQLDLNDSVDYKQQVLQIKKTIKVTPAAPKMITAPVALKRKAATVSGPLKLIKPTGSAHIPVITPPKRAKLSPPARTKEPMQVRQTYQDEEEGSVQDYLSPLQGFRVYVTNLHPVVNQDDIIELFGAIGALRRAKLIKKGTAEVVYIKKDDALKSVEKYHNRELDGLPMQVKVLTSTTAPIKTASQPIVEDNDDGAEMKGTGPLKLLKQPSTTSSATSILRAQIDAESNVELPLVHKALFKLGSSGTSKSVTFTVKI